MSVVNNGVGASFDARKLFELLPVSQRLRDLAQAVVTPGWLPPPERAALATLQAKVDAGLSLLPAEQAQYAALQKAALAGPLASLLAVLAEQVGVLEEDLDQLYDDQFIETCAAWVVPYIGDLIGYKMLHGVAPRISSPRAEVAHTIAFRRRKGTAVVLEQLARDVTGWNARAVEFFQVLITTQYMNHKRLFNHASPDLRAGEALERVGTAFDSIPRTVDMRRIASARGRYNIPNVGLFLWRIDAQPLTRSPAVAVDARRFRFHPLGLDQPLYTRPQTEDDITQLATPLNAPLPLSRRVLDAHLGDYYGDDAGPIRSLRVYTGDGTTFTPVAAADLCVCNLSDDGSPAAWAHLPTVAAQVAVDPVLGRIGLAPGFAPGTQVKVDFHYGFSADLGGGEYERASSFATAEAPSALLKVPGDFPTIQQALTALAGAGVVEIQDSGRYAETVTIDAAMGRTVELRAANGHRPTLVLGGELTVTGGTGSEVRLDGLLLTGAAVRAPAGGGNALARLGIRHCTLVPGLTLAPDCTPVSPTAPSLIAEVTALAVTLERSIVGGVRADATATVSASESIVDATASTGVAYAAPDGVGAGGALTLDACTVVGKVNARTMPLVSNSMLLAELGTGDTWTSPVVAVRRQEGCVRFSLIPTTARVPRRYQCLPESASSPQAALVRFTSLRYGNPAYAQLATCSGSALLTGADDEGQPGAFHALFQPQRETNLRVRLGEYLRTSLEAGIFYDS